MEFNEVIKKRASVRNYGTKKPDVELVIKAIESSNLAPSPGNLNIIKWIIVEDKQKIEKIAEASQQEFIKQSQILVVFCSDPKKAESIYDDRADRYVKQHAGAAIENFLLKITESGLSACWIGAYVDESIRAILGIPENIEVEAVFPIGYQAKLCKTKQKQKVSIFERVFFEKWNNKYHFPLEKVRREDI
ncbi:MAG: nitroreductase family protein [Candidatus Nanoarchaeia archaeon]|nr:nitroreductase family protein [Candidatus Nanoarchaeia archaeon]